MKEFRDIMRQNPVPGPILQIEGVQYPGPTMERIGPKDDPSIVIMGSFKIGGQGHYLMGLRVIEARGSSIVDYRDGVSYIGTGIYQLLNRLKRLAGTEEPNVVEFMDAHYVFWTEPGEQ